MTNPNLPDDPVADEEGDEGNPACVIVFNASDPSGAAMSFDLCEIVQERGLDTIGIRVQSAMDHTSLMEEEGLTTPPDPESGPPFTISPATFMLDLSLELN